MFGEFHSLTTYRRYCRSLLRFRLPLEHAVRSLIPDGIEGWQFLPIAHLLRDDLKELGEQIRENEIPAYRLDADRLLGALYVLEGASLGAQLLVKRAMLLGLSPRYGARHLALQTSDPKRWPAFVKVLENQIERPNQAVRGAMDAFAAALEAFRHEH